MMLRHEVEAERPGGRDPAFGLALGPTLGPAPPLHPGNQTRPHDSLFRDDTLQLTRSVASLGKHPQYSPQVPAPPAVKTVDIAGATAPLSEYVRQIRKGSLVVLRRGKAMAAVVPLDSDEWEDFVASQDPGFIEIMQRSERRYRAEGGVPLEEVCRKHGHTPRPARKS
jgi:hypothetical protein